MTNWKWISRNQSCYNQGTIPEFSRSNWEELWKTSVQTADIWVEIRTWDLLPKNPQLYRWIYLLVKTGLLYTLASNVLLSISPPNDSLMRRSFWITLVIGESNLSSRTKICPTTTLYSTNSACTILALKQGFRDVKSAKSSLKYGRERLLKWNLKAGFILGTRKVRRTQMGYSLAHVKSPCMSSRRQHVTFGVSNDWGHSCSQLQATASCWGWQCLISGDIASLNNSGGVVR